MTSPTQPAVIEFLRSNSFNKVQLAEYFHSLQGEGHYVNTPMLFLRFSGCSVGKYLDSEKPGVATCTDFVGNQFICDTDFRKQYEMTWSELIMLIGNEFSHVRRICLTGGEPFDRKYLPELIRFIQFHYPYMKFHIETSGTKVIPRFFEQGAWICCSPKKGIIHDNFRYIDELKLLVGESTPAEEALVSLATQYTTERSSRGLSSNVFVQPVDSTPAGKPQPSFPLERAKQLALRHNWRLSMQLHKILGVR